MVSTPMLPGTDPKATDDSVEESAAAETTPLASPTTPAPSSEDSKKPGSPKGFLAVLVLAFLASVAAVWWHDEVLSVAVPLCESIKELSDPVKMAVIGGALIVESVIPVPLYGITLLASGFVLGFPLAFLTVYPATIIGSTLMFLLSRNCCLGSARAVIESRRNLKAIGASADRYYYACLCTQNPASSLSVSLFLHCHNASRTGVGIHTREALTRRLHFDK